MATLSVLRDCVNPIAIEWLISFCSRSLFVPLPVYSAETPTHLSLQNISGSLTTGKSLLPRSWPGLQRVSVNPDDLFTLSSYQIQNSIKILVISFKTLHGDAPVYIRGLLQLHPTSRSLSSSEQSLLAFPRSKLKSKSVWKFKIVASKPQSIQSVNGHLPQLPVQLDWWSTCWVWITAT